mgnify:CR=1 FL=1|tara:strand:- start:1119 stop:2594 length:1476 start_codon:yes stop_codon:yes gene_type:complete
MAIDDFAPSLIANARKQNKASEKNDLTYSLAKLAGRGLKSVFTSALTASSDAFQQNEKLMAEKIKYKEAVTDASGFVTTQGLIDKSGKTGEEYFYDNSYESFKKQLISELPPEISGNERLFDALIRKELDPLTKNIAAEHAKGLELAGTIDTFENYNTDLNTKLKRVRPDNVGDALFGSIGRLFSGKTKAEQEAEVLAAIRTGPMSKSATAMTAFEEQYTKTRNTIRSFNFANLVASEDIQKIADEKKDIIENITESHTVTSDGVVYKTTKKETINNISKEKNTVSRVVKEESLKDPKEDKLKQVKSMTSAVNLAKFPKDVLVPLAFSNFVESITNMDLNPLDIRTPQEYAAIAKVLATFTANPDNLQDKFSDGILTASVAALAKEGSGLPELLLSLDNSEPGSPREAELTKKVIDTRKGFYGAAEIIQDTVIKGQNLNVTPVTPRPVMMRPIVNMHPGLIAKVTWSALNPTQQAKYNAMTASQIKNALNP